jgi:hypothetical protein
LCAFPVSKSVDNFIIDEFTNKLKITDKSFTDVAFLSMSPSVNLLPMEDSIGIFKNYGSVGYFIKYFINHISNVSNISQLDPLFNFFIKSPPSHCSNGKKKMNIRWKKIRTMTK